MVEELVFGGEMVITENSRSGQDEALEEDRVRDGPIWFCFKAKDVSFRLLEIEGRKCFIM